MIEILTEAFSGEDATNWGRWKVVGKSVGVSILDDDSGFTDEKELTPKEALEAFARCTTQLETMEDMTDEDREQTCTCELRNRQWNPLSKTCETCGFRYAPKPSEQTNVTEAISQAAKELKPISIDEWRSEYRKLSQEIPIDALIETEDGSPIRLNIEFYSGKPPVLFTTVYVPNCVCGKLGWFGARENDTNLLGWRVIILNGSRDIAIRRLDITQPYLLVRSIHIIKVSAGGRLLLAEIAEFL